MWAASNLVVDLEYMHLWTERKCCKWDDEGSTCSVSPCYFWWGRMASTLEVRLFHFSPLTFDYFLEYLIICVPCFYCIFYFCMHPKIPYFTSLDVGIYRAESCFVYHLVGFVFFLAFSRGAFTLMCNYKTLLHMAYSIWLIWSLQFWWSFGMLQVEDTLDSDYFQLWILTYIFFLSKESLSIEKAW